jgi:hypothetical protein
MSDAATTYRPTGQYGLLAAFGVGAAIFCAWALWRQFDWITLFFLFGCLFAALSFATRWVSRVELDPQGFWLRAPAAQPARRISPARRRGRGRSHRTQHRRDLSPVDDKRPAQPGRVAQRRPARGRTPGNIAGSTAGKMSAHYITHIT